MLDFVKRQWEKNAPLLEKAISSDTDHESWYYKDLVELVVRYILNDGISAPQDKWSDAVCDWNDKAVTEIDDGDYQGTLLFLIPRWGFQLLPEHYLCTYVVYGSCSICDTLQHIQWGEEAGIWENQLPTWQQVKDYMTLCRHLACQMVQPFAEDQSEEVFNMI